MKWQEVHPPAKPVSASAIKAGMNKSGHSMTLYFSTSAIDEHFGGEITGRTFLVESAFEEGRAHLRITPDAEGTLHAVRSIRNSARIHIARFAACLPDDKTKAEACKVIDTEEESGAIVLRLPEWATVPPMPPKSLPPVRDKP